MDDPQLVRRIRELAADRPRFGYRRIHALVRRDDRWKTINRKVVYRLYRAAGLAVRRRRQSKMRITRPLPSKPVTQRNERWSMDFVHDSLADGRPLRAFNVVDAYTRECHAIEVASSLPAGRIVAVLEHLVQVHGLPTSLRVDNGPEFISITLGRWAERRGIKLDFIQPGKPTQNAHIESFNGRFRDECLAQHRFPTLPRAKAEIELYRVDYNNERPHSALNYRTPRDFGILARTTKPASPGAAAALFDRDPQPQGRDRAQSN